MKLKDISEKLTTKWVVHFEEMMDDVGEQPTFYVTINVKELHDDWMSKCEFCPENGTRIYNVMLGDDEGHTYLMETGYEFDFDDLMHFIEDVLGQV